MMFPAQVPRFLTGMLATLRRCFANGRKLDDLAALFWSKVMRLDRETDAPTIKDLSVTY